MILSKDSDLELQVSPIDYEGLPIDVTRNWLTIEVKVGKSLFTAESDKPNDEDPSEPIFENCYIEDSAIVCVIPAGTLEFGTVYIRCCVHEVNEHFKDGYKDVWTAWQPIDLAITTEKGINQ